MNIHEGAAQGKSQTGPAAVSLPCSFLTDFIYLFYCFCHSFRAIKFREETLAARISFAAQHGIITGSSKTSRM
jgi:hypothetical protein